MNQPPGALSLPSQSWLSPSNPQSTPCSPGPETSGGPTGGENCFPKEGRKESKHCLILYRLLLLLPSLFGTAFFPANPSPPCPPQPGRGYLWCHCIEMGGLEESCSGLLFTCSEDAVTEPCTQRSAALSRATGWGHSPWRWEMPLCGPARFPE